MARTGDISVTGLYIDLDGAISELGSLHELELQTEDGTCGVHVLARVVRLARVDDFWRGQAVVGAAFQFLSERRRAEAEPIPAAESLRIRELVRRVLSAQKAGGLEHRWPGVVGTDQAPHQGSVCSVSMDGLVLETDFPLPEGELVHVELPNPTGDGRIEFRGRAAVSIPSDEDVGPLYRTDLRFEPNVGQQSLAGESISDALDTLVRATLPPAPVSEASPSQLTGQLSNISLISVLTLCAFEQVTGVLHLRRGGKEIQAFLRGGRLIDVDGSPRGAEPRTRLRDAMSWSDGEFEVRLEPVDRPDRIGCDTNALLIDLAREQDEVSRE